MRTKFDCPTRFSSSSCFIFIRHLWNISQKECCNGSLTIELILNSVNINFIMFDTMLADTLMQGQIFTIFIITIAAAEVGIGLAIVLMLFRNRQTANINEFDLMKW